MLAVQLDHRLPDSMAARLLAFRRDVVRALPGSVEDVVLFGSRARGDAVADSDYDIAVLLRGSLADDRDIRRIVSDVAWTHRDCGCVIQVVPLNAAAFHPPRTEIARRIAAEGVAVR